MADYAVPCIPTCTCETNQLLKIHSFDFPLATSLYEAFLTSVQRAMALRMLERAAGLPDLLRVQRFGYA